MSEILLSIANKIKFYRKNKGLTLNELASMSNVNKNYLVSLEKGTANITINKLESICKALNIQVKELFNPNNEIIDTLYSNENEEYIIKILELLTQIKSQRDLLIIIQLLESMNNHTE